MGVSNTPADGDMRKRFRTGYMDAGVFDLGRVVNTAMNDLADVEFDTFVGIGMSGAVVIPMLAWHMDKHYVIVRKEDDDSHHGGSVPFGLMGERFIFFDDFISSGRTFKEARRTLNQAMLRRDDVDNTTMVGIYEYQGRRDGDGDDNDTRWTPWTETDDEFFRESQALKRTVEKKKKDVWASDPKPSIDLGEVCLPAPADRSDTRESERQRLNERYAEQVRFYASSISNGVALWDDSVKKDRLI